VRATAVEKARPWIATAAALTPTLSRREREQCLPENEALLVARLVKQPGGSLIE